MKPALYVSSHRAKIVEGRLQKIQDEMALVNQESLTDPNKKVSEIIKETIAAVGENIQVRGCAVLIFRGAEGPWRRCPFASRFCIWSCL